jgi:hypothetical protein
VSLSPFAKTKSVALADINHVAVSEGRIRIRISLVLFLTMIAIVLVRLAEVSLLSPDGHLRSAPEALVHDRADITDRNGLLLATTLSIVSRSSALSENEWDRTFSAIRSWLRTPTRQTTTTGVCSTERWAMLLIFASAREPSAQL